MAQEKELFAFVSYRRADASGLAKWLQRKIKNFKLPTEVIERLDETSRQMYEAKPEVFIDVSNEKASDDFLQNKIYPSLDRAKNLIVISTPLALEPQVGSDGTAVPNWLEREVDRYLGPVGHESSRPVFVVLGPNSSKTKLPGRLNNNRHHDWVDMQNASLWQRVGLGTALEAPVAKLISGLYDVPDELVPLVHKEEQRIRTKRTQVFATIAVLASVTFGSLSLYALNQKSIAETQSGIATAKTKTATAAFLGSEALRLSQSRFDLAALLAVEARNVENSIASRRTLLDVLASNPYVEKYRKAHKKEARSLDFSGDDRFLVSGGSHGSLAMWDVRSREKISSNWQSGLNAVHKVAFAPNTPMVAVSGSNKQVQLWDVTDPSVPKRIESKIVHTELPKFRERNARFKNIQAVAFSPDGTLLATGGDDNEVRVWRMPDQKLIKVLKAHKFLIKEIAFASDNSHLAVGDDGWKVSLWRVESDSVEQVSPPVRSGHGAWILSLGISPNDLVVTGAGGGRVIGRKIDRFKESTVSQSINSSRIYGLDFIHEGKTIVFGNGAGEVGFMDHKTGRLIGTVLRAHRSGIRSLAATSDGSTVVTGATDGTLVFWDLTGLERDGREPAKTLFKRKLVSTKVYEVAEGQKILTMAVSPDGHHLVINGEAGAIKVIDTKSWRQMDTVFDGHSEVVRAIDFTRDGQFLATSGKDKAIILWDYANQTIVRRFSDESCVPTGLAWDLDFSADGRYLQSTFKVHDPEHRDRSSDAVVGLWDVRSGHNVACLRGFRWHGTDSEFVPSLGNYSLMVGSWDRRLQLWVDPISERAKTRLIKTNRAQVYATDFSQGGKRFALSGVAKGGGGQISIWDVKNDGPALAFDNELRLDQLEPDAATETVTRAKFSNDGKMLATASKDGRVTLWDADTGKVIAGPVRAHLGRVAKLAFAPTTNQLISAGHDGTIRVWQFKHDALVKYACNLAGRSLTEEELARYVGDVVQYERDYQCRADAKVKNIDVGK